ncbi:CRISPR-associated helicase Cas3' [Isoptericola sp. BMS4]|uniref:CRISPR-associated helicase Cas3' n=1 Tax=Isoptericola sp. BMS4 TaxID=2527875 RepID=UPI00141EF3EA|nr:CRISPR-associated helicase Cas3' [Isoptericola sp. BMS4]
MNLSAGARSVWAKSWPQRQRDVEQWSPLWRHLQDSAAVAGRLWDEWLPAAVTRQIAEACGGDDAGRTLLVLLSGVHDVGKASPAFAVQVDALRDQMVRAGLPMPHRLPERSDLPHGLAGQVVFERWLEERYGWQRPAAGALGSVIGGHHGVPPSSGELNRARRNLELLGDGPWARVQDELIEHMAQHTGATGYLSGDVWHRVPQHVLATLLGLVVVADWLASNQDLFPLVPVGTEAVLPQPPVEDAMRLDAAWADAHLPPPWHPKDLRACADEILRTRFELPDGASARPVQAAAIEVARTMDAQGILVVEAPMGEGKTEAALAAAEILAARSGAGGLMVALPTQATSDAMFARVMRWLARTTPDAGAGAGVEKALVPDAGGENARRSVYLAHGKAWLNPDFSRVPRGRPRSGDVGRDEAGGGAYVDSWMTGRRKGVLADVVVGTIDQVLFAALQSRHVALRHLALARKVVVLDEVHSFDAYMNVYLERALEWLGAYGVPVVALSATLPPRLRDRLVDAYRRGRAAAGGASVRRDRRRDRPRPAVLAAPAPGPASSSVADLPSPAGPTPSSSRVTALTGGVAAGSDVEGAAATRRVAVETAADEDVVALVRDAVVDGGCVLVVRNTVRRAQETFRDLQDVLGTDVVLLHSRFLASDRKHREQRLVEQLGPPSHGGGRGSRPKRLVVVATQVVEQSLDVDFDLLVTDLAPTDLLLQRIGRLHRHERPADHRPLAVRRARAVVVGVDDWTAAPPTFPRGSVPVYGEHLLFRAAAQVAERASSEAGIMLPGDIAPLVHIAYSELPLGAPDWQEAMRAARDVSDHARKVDEVKAESFLLGAPGEDRVGLIGWLDASVGEADAQGRAQVRDSEDAFEVLVVQESVGGQWRLPDWLEAGTGGQLLEMGEVPPTAKRRALAGTAVRLPSWVAAGDLGDQVLDELEALVREAWQESPDLAGQLVLPLGDARRAEVAGCEISYDEDVGLQVRRTAGEDRRPDEET